MNHGEIRRRATGPVPALFAAAAMAVLAPAAGMAQSYPDRVTAQSHYGNGSVTAPVRINKRGYPEVRLPSGSWTDCEGNCREALRRQHLDFWETINEEAGNGGDHR